MGAAQNHMMRAIELAKRAEGKTAPNPLVGCVLVKDEQVVGEGWHKGPGLDHAEVAALKVAGDNARGSTAFVTLEPCNHTGRTGPCAEALIEAGVAEVVYALSDPNPIAASGGEALKKAGVKVSHGLCEDQARSLNRFWLKQLRAARPYVVAKFAASLDGKIATHKGDSKWITNSASRARAHDLRKEVDAIVVGANTIIADDPSLTARKDDEVVGEPLRVVLDSTARTSPGAKVFDRSGKGALLVTTTKAPESRLAQFREHGVEILILDRGHDGRPDLPLLLAALGERGVNGVMVEGGGAVLGGFFDAGLVDEVWAFVAPTIIGGKGKTPVGGEGASFVTDAFSLSNVETEMLEGDILMRGILNEKGNQ